MMPEGAGGLGSGRGLRGVVPEVGAPGRGAGVAIWDMEGHARGGLRDLGVGGALANPACVVLGSSLPGMGVKRSLQSGGILLGFLANILTILSTATNYWIHYSGGHSGLWQECSGGTCSNISCQSEAPPPSCQTLPPYWTDSPPALTTAGPLS